MKKRKILRQQKRQHQGMSKEPGRNSSEIGRLVAAAKKLLHANQFASVEGLCRRILAMDPANAEAFNLLGVCTASQGNKLLALELIGRALAINPGNIFYNCNMGIVLAQAGRAEQALDYFEKALEIDSDNIEVLFNLIELYEKTNQLEKMKQRVENALRLEPDSYLLQYQLAKCEYRAGNYDTAYHLVSGLLDEKSRHDLTQKSYHLLAEACDRLGKYEEAYNAFAKANSLLADSSLVRNQETERIGYFQLIDKLGNSPSFVTGRVQDGQPVDLPVPPVFLVGFPRSGTTLTGQLLGAHPAIHTFDEKGTLSHMLRDFFSLEKYQRLAALTPEEINAYRMEYRATVENLSRDADITDQMIIDKCPLYICNLEMIQLFFPESKVIVIHRDPRDVCLSNFMQDFIPTPCMNNFLSLENTVLFYEKTMGLYLQDRERLSLPLMEVHYEDLVRDMKGALGGILSSLGKEWVEEINDFYLKSRERFIKTPSYQQVVKPLYSSSVGRWRNYADQIAPFLKRLQVFARALGYEQDTR